MPHDRASLNPKLQQALSCLDLQLEDELTRYRRQKAGLSVAPIVMRPKQPPKKPVELTQTNPDAPPKAISFDLGKSAYAERGASIAETPSIDESAMIPYESETAGEALFEMAYEDSAPPDDYLESSEHLLRSLEREEAKVEVERGFLQSLSTPLGIGSMLTLLVSSAMLGYVIMNPAILGGIAQRFSQPEVAESPTPEASTADISTSPRLDRDEFSELGLESLSVIRTKPTPVPSVSPSPSPSASPAAPSAIVPPSIAPSPAVSPSPIASSSVLLPSVSVPRTQPPAPVIQSPSRPSQYYRVEAPFTGDQSLATARQVVPDAFVRSDGKIQLAATVTESEAQKKVQELKNRGLSANVQKP
ncbi:hypothetical protein [Leptolyngbya sp. NIES-2104]|uniref:hypothetical protein n=1 Tax=Leptolyngbya sp. NIES-2104 TaxID=1552121 RepID=UPI0006EC5925|nr:hypothetical protein [Leptolyngbya sp. NIES-2104]GAP94597.1 serine/threonine protein kinase [Leptolyngbya sp. NIES-2104]